MSQLPCSPDESLLAVYQAAAEIIHANYLEHAHDLLAEMARHDVFEFLMEKYLAEQAAHDRARRVA